MFQFLSLVVLGYYYNYKNIYVPVFVSSSVQSLRFFTINKTWHTAKISQYYNYYISALVV